VTNCGGQIKQEEMQPRWRVVVVMCVRGPLRGSLSRSGLWTKLSLAALLCGLCLLFSYHHISSSRSKITDRRTDHFLVAASSLLSFTEISRQYSSESHDRTASQRLHQNVLKTPLSLSTPPAPSIHTEDHVRASKLSTESLRTKSQSLTPDTRDKWKSNPTESEPSGKLAKSPEKWKYSGESVRGPRVLLLYGAEAHKQSTEARLFLEAHRISFLHTSLLKGRHLLSEAGNSSSGSGPLSNLALVIVVSQFHSSTMEPYLDLCQARLLPLI
jgi:hypothetical protein